MNLKLLIKRNISFINCPVCNSSSNVEKLSPHKFPLRILRLINICKYYCRKCKNEGFYFRYRFSVNYKTVLFNYIVTILFLIIFCFLLSKLLTKL